MRAVFPGPTPAHLFNRVREMMWETRELAWGENGGKAWAWPETRVKTQEQGQKRLRLLSVPEQAAVSLGRKGRSFNECRVHSCTHSLFILQRTHNPSLCSEASFIPRLSLCDPIPESSCTSESKHCRRPLSFSHFSKEALYCLGRFHLTSQLSYKDKNYLFVLSVEICSRGK